MQLPDERGVVYTLHIPEHDEPYIEYRGKRYHIVKPITKFEPIYRNSDIRMFWSTRFLSPIGYRVHWQADICGRGFGKGHLVEVITSSIDEGIERGYLVPFESEN